jgi:hypothetical protein
MSDYDDEKRGENAQNLLKDPLLRKALDAARQVILEAWQKTPVRDNDGREYLWKLHQASLRFEEILFGYVQNGEIAKHKLKEKLPIRERIRSVY